MINRKKLITIFSAVLMTFSISALSAPRKLVVADIRGGVELISASGRHLIQKGETLTDESVINMPYKSYVTIISESDNKEYLIYTPGRSTIEEKMKDRRNTMLKQTKNYVSAVLRQLSNKGSAAPRRYSDPAAVTREEYKIPAGYVSTSPSTSSGNYRSQFDAFRSRARKEYADFRKKAFEEYAQFVRQAWKEFGAEPPREMPHEPEIEPMLVPDADAQTASWFSSLFKKKRAKDSNSKPSPTPRKQSEDSQLPVKTIVTPLPTKHQPQPLSDVKDTPEGSNDYMVFSVFGTECLVRIGDNCRFRLNGITENDIADALMEFTKPQYDNMLYDCLQERDRHNFSDWAYYRMLVALTNSFYGKGTNEATLTLAFLYSQSGYKMRLAHSESQLRMLLASEHIIYNKAFFHVDGDNYYALDGEDTSKLSICQASFPKESSLSLQISSMQEFSENQSTQRTIASRMNPDFSFTVTSNKNFIDFCNTYPSSCFFENFMTRWSLYANTPMEKGLRAQLYPAIIEKLQGLSHREAVQQLLWWVQTGMKYGYDDEIWGCDRAFFAEESIFYPFCDCEDRSILLSRLVRDLIGLPVVLVYYPGHLATAVHFPEGTKGDYIVHEGRRFTICDPTYIPANVGMTMPDMKNDEAVVILLD